MNYIVIGNLNVIRLVGLTIYNVWDVWGACSKQDGVEYTL